MGCITKQKELKCSAMYQNHTFQRSFIGTGGRHYQAKCDIKQMNHKKITTCNGIFARYCITITQALCLSVYVDFVV